MSEHTPGPWTRGGIGFPYDPERRTENIYGPHEKPKHQSGPRVATLIGPRSSADAEHIIRCVNAHDDLLEACKAVVNAFALKHSWTEAVAREMSIVRTAIDKAETP